MPIVAIKLAEAHVTHLDHSKKKQYETDIIVHLRMKLVSLKAEIAATMKIKEKRAIMDTCEKFWNF